MVPRSTVLYARAAGYRYRSRVRPHHQRDWRGDDRLAWRVDVVLRHAEGASGIAECGGREAGGDRVQDCGACRGRGAASTGGTGPRRRLELCTVSFQLEQTVRAFA